MAKNEPNIKGAKAKGMNDYRISNAKKVNSKKFPNGYIYVLNIEGTDFYKFGVSQNPARRISDLSNATPFNILIIYAEQFNQVYEVETLIHNKIEDFYIKNEWFELSYLDALEAIFILNEIKPTSDINPYIKELQEIWQH